MSTIAAPVLKSSKGVIYLLTVTNDGLLEVEQIPISSGTAMAPILRSPGGLFWMLSVTYTGQPQVTNEGGVYDTIQMRSPDGSAWEVTVTDEGILEVGRLTADMFGIFWSKKQQQPAVRSI